MRNLIKNSQKRYDLGDTVFLVHDQLFIRRKLCQCAVLRLLVETTVSLKHIKD